MDKVIPAAIVAVLVIFAVLLSFYMAGKRSECEQNGGQFVRDLSGYICLKAK